MTDTKAYQSKIRNFSIVAHIDHGKSTLADRLIAFTGGLTDREMSEQVLDNMDIEKERGITIKAQTVRLEYTAKDGETYILNLMDTPGHVDFAYEVSRSLSACEGSILVVDASQGVEAQTLANVYQAIEHDHEIIPVLNKIDLPAAEPERVKQQIEEVIGLDASDAVECSAKSGIGIEDVLEAIATRLPPARAIPSIRSACLNPSPPMCRLWGQARWASLPPLLKKSRTPLWAIQLPKINAQPKPRSKALNPRSPLLHLEIIQERLEREFDLDLITTAPSVVYTMVMRKGDPILLHNPADMPDVMQIEHIEEPWIKATIMTPDEYLGGILKLCQEMEYELPLNEVVFDFYDRLKSVSKGYASFDYQSIGLREGDLVKMSILVNGDPVDALSMLVHRKNAESRGRQMCERLKDLIPRHMFKIPVQAAIGGRIIARETIAAMRKDVTAKCYGGDASRKRKLLDKQKKGKKRMRQFGRVEIPQEAFIAALKMDDD